MEVMRKFQWREFAFFYSLTTTRKGRKCYYVQKELSNVQNLYSDIEIVLKRQIDEADSKTMRKLLSSGKSRARIFLVCLETGYQKRQFMKSAVLENMVTEEYVYVYVETSRSHFGKVPFWIDDGSENDGMDAIIKEASKRILIVDLRPLNLT
ncbi:hypothetical protein AB6A40_011635, partial [Gnathostoma spinigerum]